MVSKGITAEEAFLFSLERPDFLALLIEGEIVQLENAERFRGRGTELFSCDLFEGVSEDVV